jgi:hypothetical protein
MNLLKRILGLGRGAQAAQCFDDYQAWYDSLDRCDDTLDVTLTVRVRAFGCEAVKQRAWADEWRSKHPEWGPVAAGCSVSSDPPEVWMDLRVCRAGLVLPPHVLQHEVWHLLRLKDKRLIDPDLLVKEGSY